MLCIMTTEQFSEVCHKPLLWGNRNAFAIRSPPTGHNRVRYNAEEAHHSCFEVLTFGQSSQWQLWRLTIGVATEATQQSLLQSSLFQLYNVSLYNYRNLHPTMLAPCGRKEP